MLSAQINSLFADIPPAAIKTGMLYSTENIEAVVKCLEAHCENGSQPPSKPYSDSGDRVNEQEC